MKDHSSSQNMSGKLGLVLAAVVAICLLPGACAVAAPSPWWDCIPRFVVTSDLQTAQDYHASMSLNGVGSDPGWGPWFSWGSPANFSAAIHTRKAFDGAGIHSISYTNAFGGCCATVVSTGTGTPVPIIDTNYCWQAYNGADPVKWAGAWTWFDDAEFARPYTRSGPICPGSPATYPDGTVATGFINNDSSDPRNTRVYDACCPADIFGKVKMSYDYSDDYNAPGGMHTGLLYIPATGKYTGDIAWGKDPACPMWSDFAHAFTELATAQMGSQGTWCDNMSPWSSFAGSPLESAFGKWPVARFRTYLHDHFSVGQLIKLGVLAPGQTYADLSSFDIRAYLKNKAGSTYGWNGVDLSSAAWSNSGWINEPVWNAYKIFKRQTGSEGLANYYNAMKKAGVEGGQPDYLVMGNDVIPSMLGWNRGSMDMVSTELSLSWNLSAGPRGFGLPPFARIAPFYKSAREQGKSRFLNVWLYNDSHPDALKVTEVVNVLYYEMLATHTTPKLEPTNSRMVGNPAADKAFMQFVADKLSPEIGARIPVEDIGIYSSTSSILSQWTPGGILDFDAQPNEFGVWGWATALDELHYQYRIIPEWKLSADTLKTLKVLIVPNSEVFTSSDAGVLGSWVRKSGGILIVTGNSGHRQGESGNFAVNAKLSLGSLTGVATWASAPASKTRTIGAGYVRFIKDNVGLNFWAAAPPQRTNLLTAFSNEMSTALSTTGKHVVLISSDAPVTTGLTLYQDEKSKRLFVDVNNVNVTIAGDNNSAVVTPTPTIEVTVYKPAWWNASQDGGLVAYAISPDGPVTLPAPMVSGERINVTVPPTKYYTSVVLAVGGKNPISAPMKPGKS